MVIERGAEWGRPSGVVQPVRAADDADVVRLQDVDPPCTSSGNLHRALGEPGSGRERGGYTELPLDALVCTVRHGGSTREMVACAEVAVGRWFGRHGLVVVTNVGVWNGLDVTPGSHPNDGRFEFLAVDRDMSLRQRMIARRRARTGSHLPHPMLERGSRTEITITRRDGQHLLIDSVDVGPWSSVTVVIAADRLRVLV